jgi:hypothetical protein
MPAKTGNNARSDFPKAFRRSAEERVMEAMMKTKKAMDVKQGETVISMGFEYQVLHLAASADGRVTKLVVTRPGHAGMRVLKIRATASIEVL